MSVFLRQSYSDIIVVVTCIECTHVQYNVILFDNLFKAIHVMLTCAQNWYTRNSGGWDGHWLGCNPWLCMYVVYCVVLYNMYLNTSLLSSVKVFFVEGVTMYSWLVTVLLLASATSRSGGQGAGGKARVRVYQLVCLYFSPQVHKCPSQATHVRNLT